MPSSKTTMTTLLLLLQWLHVVIAYETVSNQTLLQIPRPGNDFNINEGGILAPILRTRLPGTPGSTAVRNHFVDFFYKLPGWKIEFQNSTAKTPVSDTHEVPFVNFIASRDPPEVDPGNVGRLTLVAHYDSKRIPKGFIGAIDSAVPCAVIMHAVRSINTALTNKWNEVHVATGQQPHRKVEGIQVIFTDGEEGLADDSRPGDALYGSRALAKDWASQKYSPGSTYPTRIASISLFVLLDLLGSSGPHIASGFQKSHWAYQNLAHLERRLRELKLLNSSKSDPGRSPFRSWFVDAEKRKEDLSPSGVSDDHVPFLNRGVDVLHVIDFDPMGGGFPQVWHTLDDDGKHLDLAVVENWSLLVIGFIAEWLELEGFMGDHPMGSHPDSLDGDFM